MLQLRPDFDDLSSKIADEILAPDSLARGIMNARDLGVKTQVGGSSGINTDRFASTIQGAVRRGFAIIRRAH